MLADIVLIVWILMTAVLGWKRRAAIELRTVLFLSLSYILARFAGLLLAPIASQFVAPGPITASAIVALIIWPIIYGVFAYAWKNFLPKQSDEAGIRIKVDAEGNPQLNHFGLRIQKLLGFVIGLIRGLVFYAGFIFFLMILTPSYLYTPEGRRITVVRTDSISMYWLHQIDPTLRRLDQVTAGLQILHAIRTKKTHSQRANQNPEIRKLLQTPQIKKIQRETKLLAHAITLGRRNSTLLLWIPQFQQLAADPSTASILQQITALYQIK
jgi:hypothetical protein